MGDATGYLLWGRPSSLNVQKVLVALEACGIDAFEFRHASAWLAPGAATYGVVDASLAAVNTDEYRRLNPNPTVPTLRLPAARGGGALWESNVIVRYLARVHAPELIGGGCHERAASCEKWMDWQACRMGKIPVKSLIDHTARLPMAERDAGAFSRAAIQAAEALAVVESHLADSAFLGGDAFSVADIPLGTVVNRIKLTTERAHQLFGDALNVSDVPSTPNIDRWYASLLLEPAFRKGAVLPEMCHVSLSVKDELPPWMCEYNRRYGV